MPSAAFDKPHHRQKATAHHHHPSTSTNVRKVTAHNHHPPTSTNVDHCPRAPTTVYGRSPCPQLPSTNPTIDNRRRPTTNTHQRAPTSERRRPTTITHQRPATSERRRPTTITHQPPPTSTYVHERLPSSTSANG